jgi:hypothetical protein
MIICETMNLFKVLALRAKSVIFHIGEACKAEFSPAKLAFS